MNTTERMADAIAARIKERGFCHARDLQAKNFTLEEIGECWAMANALAAVSLIPNYNNIIAGGYDERRYFH